ncbi:MAG TPA: trypsin-like peptidase domain-containing protein [Myxococcota bacterium]|nr:trypsin-like peptidase domain-containing protein [Myxococcota bacterium]
MFRKMIPLFLMCSAAAVMSCSQTDLSQRPERPKHIDYTQSGIINGSLDTTHQAVVAVLASNAACSGTIIEKNGNNLFVLTAAHCVTGMTPQWIVQGNDYYSGSAIVYNVADYEAHPSYSGGDYDFGMIRAVGAGPGTPVIPALTSAQDNLATGTQIIHVGYGLTSYPNGDTTQRHYIDGTLDGVDSITIWYGESPGGPCSGDSGGPQLTRGTERVGGVTSYGDQNCAIYGVSGRVSAVYDSFIRPYIDGTPITMTCDECFSAVTGGQGACMTEVNACYNDSDCYAMLECFSNCSSSDQACYQACADQHPSGLQIYYAIYDCVCETGCVDECADDPLCQTTLKPLGESCGDGSECDSTFCTDGVCCESTCSGQCQACDVAGDLGYCNPVTGDPHGTRPACTGDGGACDGACDGTLTTACAYPGAGTQCRTASCAVGTATLPAECGGTGVCPAVQTIDCAPFSCDGYHCGGGCSVDNDCPAGYFCAGGVCILKLVDGEACSGSNQCQAGHCTDGVCCDDACAGQCQACDVAGHIGQCSPVTGVPRGTRPACTTDGSLCGGACDGTLTTACAYPGAGSQCRAPACSNGTATLAAGCDGTGSCPAEQNVSCAPYSCEGDHCSGSCTSDNDCPSGYYCAGGLCEQKLPNGTACAGGNQCLTARCIDGVCCNTGCVGQCQACDLAGHLGSCTPVIGAPHGARQACAADGSACAGACDGINGASCAYPGNYTVCRAASCSAGVAVVEARCMGVGACPQEQTVNCAPYDCSGVQCAGGCVADFECGEGYFCSAGMCLQTFAEGHACGGDEQCDSGFCTDGVCCLSACDGQCEACDIAGSLGSCGPVSGSPRGGRAVCLGVGSCKGSCDGTDSAACVYPGSETQCSAASCLSGMQTAAAFCDAAGACGQAGPTSCGDYTCGQDACLTTCQADVECAAGKICKEGACIEDGGSQSNGGCSTTGGASGSGLLILALLGLALVGSRGRER